MPVDGQKADKTPAAADRAWRASDPIYFTEWPRRTLHRFMHAAMASHIAMTEAALAALRKDDAPTAEESLDALRQAFRKGDRTHPFPVRDFVWGVETIAGTRATLEAVASEVEAFEATTDDPNDGYTGNPACRAAIVEAAAFMLVRATPAVAASARKRLDQTFSAPLASRGATPLSSTRSITRSTAPRASGAKRQSGRRRR